MSETNNTTTTTGKKPIRVYVDGCFDLMHFGHANALRQARELGDILVVGVHTDAEIAKNKGPPVMNEQERYKAVRACKWADEVAEGAPYTATVELLDQLNCDFCVHGEDISVGADGKDVYETIKKSGKFRFIKRTEGISTTELVGRMLLLTKDHLAASTGQATSPLSQVNPKDLHRQSPYTSLSHFLPTTRKIVQFSEGKAPKDTDRIVYMDGGFDLFHVGHTEALRQAKELGDFLIVGVHDDKVVNEQKGSNFPIMNLHERVLSVLSCRYVDEVIIGAPFNVTKEMIESLRINTVVHGDDPVVSVDADPYKLPKGLGIYKEIKHTEGLTATEIVRRIIENRMQFEARNKKKQQNEVTFIQQNQ
ncbi:phosphoethanolamine-cytidyltransferase [Cavenderia fasciculata]|uniref:ethanolamine-phosphate cytidylyltransferase n=1 Tax=Cavenderia fasciculata TaxID=261658 RepID=F4QCT7_CACFS|nr:phosphoethanolamine-cytidyltransferase [Cavenderia fasciculata]EGG14461.1 phosphoethanolamine-cytidyltransferase [Cavenderia fasciculata]|eukprot:XP_004353870.1 phosphoethanolamine-cytidyltransferase [Cavenderia fasciculata]